MNEPKVISQIKDIFATHVEQNPGKVFKLAAANQRDLSRLSRELEKKRQIGSLTDQEQNQLRVADQLLENITKFNDSIEKKVATAPGPKYTETRVYNLAKSDLQGEEEIVPNFEVPKITQSEADKIISDIDKQFEEQEERTVAGQPGAELSDLISRVKTQKRT